MSTELEAPPIEEQDPQEAFVNAIQHLRRLQHLIDDIAESAAIELGKARSNYDHWLEIYKPFISVYAIEHAPITKDGVKAKSYRCTKAGGAVYFTSRPKRYICPSPDVIGSLFPKYAKEEISVKTVIDFEGLVSELGIEEAAKHGIVIEDENPFAKIAVGTNRAWTPNKAKDRLNKALKGEILAEEESHDDRD
jgi:hypothetical protein